MGEPIDLAHASLRGIVIEADERRRRKNRMEGRDSDDGEGWELHPPDDTVYTSWPAVRATRSIRRRRPTSDLDLLLTSAYF